MSLMDSEFGIENPVLSQPVSKGELNSWKRGFTPQAEIWNGRMAMVGLAIGISFLVVLNFSGN